MDKIIKLTVEADTSTGEVDIKGSNDGKANLFLLTCAVDAAARAVGCPFEDMMIVIRMFYDCSYRDSVAAAVNVGAIEDAKDATQKGGAE